MTLAATGAISLASVGPVGGGASLPNPLPPTAKFALNFDVGRTFQSAGAGDFPVARREHRTGKSGELAGWKTCPTQLTVKRNVAPLRVEAPTSAVVAARATAVQSLAEASAVAPGGGEKDYFVALKAETKLAQLQSQLPLAARARAEFKAINTHLLRLSAAEAAALKSDPHVLFIEEDGPMLADFGPQNDPPPQLENSRVPLPGPVFG